MSLNKNIYVDVTPIPGSSDNVYSVFVFREVLRFMCKTFSDIGHKVSEHSSFKPLCERMGNAKNWNRGKPEHVTSYKKDNGKYFCELTIDEISTLRNMLFVYKSKFSGGALIMGDAEVQRNSVIKSMIAKLKRTKSVKKDNNSEGQKKLEDALNKANTEMILKQDKKFKKMLAEHFKTYDAKINKQTKEFLSVLNPLLAKENDKIDYSELVFNSNDKDKGIVGIVNGKMSKYPAKKYPEIYAVLDNWYQSVGTKILYGVKSYRVVNEYLEKGYKIFSVLGSGGTAVVVKFLNEKGKERALKLFYNINGRLGGDDGDYIKELKAVKELRTKLGNGGNFSSKKNVVKKRFNAPKIRQDGELEMKLANKVLDSDEFLKRGNKKSNLTIRFFKDLSREVLKGLKALHDKEMMHGDIKPDNIHVMNGGKFKIADVGTVCDAQEGSINTGIYTHPDWWNSPHSTTAEQKQKNDVYALGCSLLDVLCGKRVGKYAGFSQSAILSEVSPKFTDESMNKQNISELLKFISKLCAEKLDDVPTATEALKDPFVQKIAK